MGLEEAVDLGRGAAFSGSWVSPAWGRGPHSSPDFPHRSWHNNSEKRSRVWSRKAWRFSEDCLLVNRPHLPRGWAASSRPLWRESSRPTLKPAGAVGPAALSCDGCGGDQSQPSLHPTQPGSEWLNKCLFPYSVNWISSLLRRAEPGQRAAPSRLVANPVVPSQKAQ